MHLLHIIAVFCSVTVSPRRAYCPKRSTSLFGFSLCLQHSTFLGLDPSHSWPLGVINHRNNIRIYKFYYSPYDEGICFCFAHCVQNLNLIYVGANVGKKSILCSIIDNERIQDARLPRNGAPI